MWLSSTFVSSGPYRVFAVDFFIQYSSSTSGYASARANRYVVVISCCPIFRSCFFLSFLVFYRTLFCGGLQPSVYNQFCFGLSSNCKSYGVSLADSLTSSTAFRGRPRLLTSTFQGCFSNHGGKVCASGRLVSRKHYHGRARAATLVQWPVSVVAHAEKSESVRLCTSHRGWKPFLFFISFSAHLSCIDGEI